MKIEYHSVRDFEGWDRASTAFGKMIVDYKAKDILEIGAGANPTIPVSIVRNNGLNYVTNDIDPTELAKSDAGYARLCHDFSEVEPPRELHSKFDFVFSRMVNEHVRDGSRYYGNIARVLRPGGISVHFFSTLYTLPFLVNAWTPEFASALLLRLFAPRNTERQGKFKAYYSWSRGPSTGMIRRFESIGFDVLEYHGYFGHGYYRTRLPPLDALETIKTRFLVKNPVPLLTSYAKVVLSKRG